VGLLVEAKVGAEVAAGAPLCLVHAGDEAHVQAAMQRIAAAYTLQPTPVTPLPVIYEKVTA